MRLTRHAKLASMLLVGVLVLVSTHAWAGDVTCPNPVQADAQGNWTAVITVTNTDNPAFTNEIPVNTTLTSVVQVHHPEGHFTITLKGQLINKGQNGSITFSVDPPLEIVTCTLTIYPAPAIPTLTEWGVFLLAVLLVGAGWLALRRRRVLVS